ncbi:MAG: CPP1-like family protein [Cyanobacteria bacterium P01_F01_bin.153]
MSNPNPYEQLGVTEDASFDEIQAARSRLLENLDDDGNQSEAVEMAYDAVLMDRLRLRQEGRIKVPERIRFPERSTPKPVAEPASQPSVQLPDWLRDTLDSPERDDLLWPSVVFSVGTIIGVALPPQQEPTLQLLLALGVGSCFYFLNRKEKKFGRSAAVTAIAFVASLAVGAALGSITVLSEFISAAQITAVVTFIGLWATSCFVR